ncbi:MAG TPA: PAS domain S-box protein, partial [Anaerolineales bacterium]|nr:PAS domain S-box protein [Anaerolineales bacterium]
MFTITPFVLISFFALVISVYLTVVVWRRNNSLQAYYFALAQSTSVFWLVINVLLYAATDVQWKIFFRILESFGYLTGQPLMLMFMLTFAGYGHIAQKKWVKAILIFYWISNIALTCAAPWLNGLFWKEYILHPNNLLEFVPGPAYGYRLISGTLCYTLPLLVLLVIASLRGSNIQKRQARIMLLCLFIMVLTVTIGESAFTHIIKIEGYDTAPVQSAIIGILFVWALYGHNFLDVVPVARNKLINNLSDGMIALDLKNRIIDINRSAVAVLGNTEDALLGKNLEDVFPRFGSELKDIPEKEIKFELSTNDQRFYDVLISPLHDEWPQGLVGRLIILRDVTERKQTELRLLQLHKAVEQSPVSVVITDIQGNIEYVNPHFSQLTGYELNEVIGKNPRIIQSGDTSLEAYEEMWRTIQSGKIWRGELLNKKKNGDTYWEVEMIAPVIDSDGIIVNYIAIKEDVTAQKESDAKLREAYTRLEEQMNEIQGLQDELREQAIRDPLTGLHNRHYLKEVLGRELSRAIRERYPISFLLL